MADIANNQGNNKQGTPWMGPPVHHRLTPTLTEQTTMHTYNFTDNL